MPDPEGSPNPERRRARRIAVRRLTVLYHPPADAYDILHARTSHKGVAMDLSHAGMRILVWEPLLVGTQLNLTLEVPSLRRMIIVKGYVARCSEAALKPTLKKAQGPSHQAFEIGVSLPRGGADFRDLMKLLDENLLLRLDGI
jgi:hypothetical protein